MPDTAVAERVSPAAAERVSPAAATIREALRAGAAGLAAAGCESPRLDAELLLCAALGDGWSRGRLLTADLQELDRGALGRYERLLARRRAREPVAYIVGFKEFRHITLAVDRRVLIPRPESELLVEVGLTLAPGAAVADVGTGSGAVALALKDERPDLELTGIDICGEALAIARENARRLELDARFVQADLLDADRYDAVLANLPYVPDGSEELAPEITRYEPAGAIYGGRDGLAFLHQLVLRLQGTGVRLVALEVGAGQAEAVAGSFARAGFVSIERLSDLAGHERVVVGCR